ncbi:hypothetical protein AM501_24025 [Aneurinibacillus migulanus]|uniref:RepB family plasmid replication initiator protein n=1 Tax=Aneurinibacillus migulanus TaxID=47500 RepID=UPI0005B97D0D|nr:RepB family plasmid replication initiator protein [Aneurinibacillus migulanus]KIV58923.1 hypothetical protein TS64_03955 [Aneurinibacillus migulanus]KPD05845.1 hypothetical protein AM501_24025 [Aneurinibacillus migulanus]
MSHHVFEDENYDTMTSKKSESKGWSSVSRKIIKHLDAAQDKYIAILESDLKPQRELLKVQTLLSSTADKLKSEKTFELKNVLFSLGEERDGISQQPDKDAREMTFKMERKKIQFKIDIINQALKARRELSKKFSHPIERNYAEAPIFSPSSPNATTLVKLRNENGHIIEERKGFRKVRYSSETGTYLTTFDFRVFVGLQRMWEIKGGSKSFEFNYKELSDVIDSSKEGGLYDLISVSLHKLATTSLVMEDFKDESLKKVLRTEIHNIIQSAHIEHEEKKAVITFNDYLHDGLRAGNLARINLSLYQDLNSSTAKILYPLIISLISDKKQLMVDDIIETLGLTGIDRSKGIERIKKALKELVDYQIIADFTLQKIGRRYEYILIEPTEQLLESFEEGVMVPTIG